ncbi:tripartite tricarboxylate transporter substrate binding protein [Alcaligenaceae bacterium]|nr:tripartite tricarboxylate transporter substrate binding protein [Alcaligenaceae bacterium]
MNAAEKMKHARITRKGYTWLGMGLVSLMFSAGSLLATSAAHAAYPEREITFVVPYPPGGNSDNLARIFAERLREKINVPIVVENRPGGTTSLGTSQVARSKPDGYTMLLATSTAFTVLPHIRDLPYNPDKDFVFVGSLSGYLPILTVRNDFPANNLKELIDYAKKNPGKLTWGSAGVASGGHLSGEIIKNETDINMLHIPYKGSADTISALLGGHIDLFIDGVGLELVKSGRAKGLVTFSSVRHSELPDVPTPAEAGYDVTLPFEGFWGVALPVGTPPDVVAKLAKATEEILAEPETQQRFQRISMTASWKDGNAYAQDLQDSKKFYGELLKKIGFAE